LILIKILKLKMKPGALVGLDIKRELSE